MTDNIVEELVNHIQNATPNDENIHENKEEDRGDAPSEAQQDEVKPAKPKPKAKTKPKLQGETDTINQSRDERNSRH